MGEGKQCTCQGRGELGKGSFGMIGELSGAGLRDSEWLFFFKIPNLQKVFSTVPPSYHLFQEVDLDEIKPNLDLTLVSMLPTVNELEGGGRERQMNDLIT